MAYNHFIEALLINDVDAMNDYMNKIAMHSFSSFDVAQGVSDDDAPERFYVNQSAFLSDAYDDLILPDQTSLSLEHKPVFADPLWRDAHFGLQSAFFRPDDPLYTFF